MSTIEDRLWADLVREAEAELALAARQPDAEPRRPRGRWAGVGMVVLIGAVAAVVSLTASTSTTPAYAVSVSGNGAVTLTINELIGVSGANAQLAQLGVRATVVAVQPGCTATVETVAMPADAIPTIFYNVKGGFTINPNAIPAGESLLISARQSGAGVGMAIGMYRGTAPACALPEGN
jgi:hypothetical protein